MIDDYIEILVNPLGGAAAEVAAGSKVIDYSGDFRFADTGLVEPSTGSA